MAVTTSSEPYQPNRGRDRLEFLFVILRQLFAAAAGVSFAVLIFGSVGQGDDFAARWFDRGVGFVGYYLVAAIAAELRGVRLILRERPRL